jgi:transporter family-2 protein
MQEHDTVLPGRQLKRPVYQKPMPFAHPASAWQARFLLPLAAPRQPRLVSPMQWGPAAYVLFAAALLPAQAACNAAINRAIGQPVIAITISIVGSLIGILGFGALSGRLWPIPAERFGYVPWWAWAAGFGGVVFVSAQSLMVPRLGAALFTSLAVTGQVAMAVALDHFGLLNLPQHTASPMRVLGAALIVVGMTLVARF